MSETDPVCQAKSADTLPMAPILIFLPDLFTKKGNYHRIKFLRYISIFLVLKKECV
jgi:hypothetical protein